MTAENRKKTIEVFKDWKQNILPTYNRGALVGIPEALQGVASEKEAYMFISFAQASVDLFRNYMHIRDYEELICYLESEVEKRQKQA